MSIIFSKSKITRGVILTFLSLLIIPLIFTTNAFAEGEEPPTDPTPVELSDCTVSLSQKFYVYSGKTYTPSATVTDPEGNVIDSVHYTIEYLNNTKTGRASIVINAVPEDEVCTGTVTKYFYISSISYKTYKTSKKWGSWQANGVTSGTTTGNPICALQCTKGSSHIKGSVCYKVYLQGKGWTEYKSNKAVAGNYKTSIQAISVYLTQDLEKYYDVYYRVNITNLGWTGWAKNAQYAGSVGFGYIVRGVQMKFVVKGQSAPGSSYNRYITTKTYGSETKYKAIMYSKIKNMSSKTQYLTCISCTYNRIAVYKGSKGYWTLYKYWKCTTGAAATPTPKGEFVIAGHNPHFGEQDGYTCWYASSFQGDYMIHSTLYQAYSKTKHYDSRLGIHASHGCVRVSLENAKWYYETIPNGSKVYIY